MLRGVRKSVATSHRLPVSPIEIRDGCTMIPTDRGQCVWAIKQNYGLGYTQWPGYQHILVVPRIGPPPRESQYPFSLFVSCFSHLQSLHLTI